MDVPIFKMGRKKFVVLAESEYRKLQRRAATAKPSKRGSRLSAEDRYDIAEVKRVLADPGEVPIPWEKVKAQLRSKR